MYSSLTGFGNTLADIHCILHVAWPYINADTTEYIMCCVKEIWKLLKPNKLVANLLPFVLVCWTFPTWCIKNMSKNIKKFTTTLKEKQKHYHLFQINVTKEMYSFVVCV